MSNDDIDIYMAGRFNHLGGVNRFVMNSSIGNVWGTEEDISPFPFTVGVEFNMTIVVLSNGYKVCFGLNCFIFDLLKGNSILIWCEPRIDI